MRIDKWLKVARLTKRREIAKQLCDDNDILINGHLAKPMTEIHVGDDLVLQMGRHKILAKIISIREFARKEEAVGMYEIIKDEITERGGSDNA